MSDDEKRAVTALAEPARTNTTSEPDGSSRAVPVNDDEKADLVVEQDDAIIDVFKPLPPLEGIMAEDQPLTGRAVLVGIVLGSLVNASNVYLGELNVCYVNVVSRWETELAGAEGS